MYSETTLETLYKLYSALYNMSKCAGGHQYEPL